MRGVGVMQLLHAWRLMVIKTRVLSRVTMVATLFDIHEPSSGSARHMMRGRWSHTTPSLCVRSLKQALGFSVYLHSFLVVMQAKAAPVPLNKSSTLATFWRRLCRGRTTCGPTEAASLSPLCVPLCGSAVQRWHDGAEPPQEFATCATTSCTGAHSHSPQERFLGSILGSTL